MYEWTDQNLKSGQCDICGALEGHLEGCLDQVIICKSKGFEVWWRRGFADDNYDRVRQHSLPLYTALWAQKKPLEKGVVLSVVVGIVANVIIWWDVLVLLF